MQNNILLTQGGCGTNSLFARRFQNQLDSYGTNIQISVPPLIRKGEDILNDEDVHIHTRDSMEIGLRNINHYLQ
jgi:hypothetical protein